MNNYKRTQNRNKNLYIQFTRHKQVTRQRVLPKRPCGAMLICWLFHKNCRCLLLHKKKKSFLPPKRGQFVPTSFELVRSLKKFFDNSSRSVLDTITVVNAANRGRGFPKRSRLHVIIFYIDFETYFKSKWIFDVKNEFEKFCLWICKIQSTLIISKYQQIILNILISLKVQFLEILDADYFVKCNEIYSARKYMPS